MLKRLITLSLALILLGFTTGCLGGGLADGNLIGTVVREGTAALIPHPYLIIGRTLSSPTTPAQSIVGDDQGRFEITLRGGNYTVQIGTNEDGPLYTWPEEVFVEENKTTVVLFQLPEGF